MRHRQLWLVISAVLAISACSLYEGSEHTPHLTAPDAAISPPDSGCGGNHDGGGYLPDAGTYDNDGGIYSNDGGSYGGDDGGIYYPDAYLPDGGWLGLPDAPH